MRWRMDETYVKVAGQRMYMHRAIDRDGATADSGADIAIRQSKYLNNIVEQDHRAIKRIVRPKLGFKSCLCARALIAMNQD